MLAGNAISAARPGKFPWNLAHPGSRQVWMPHGDRPVDESDPNVGVALGSLHQWGEVHQRERIIMDHRQ